MLLGADLMNALLFLAQEKEVADGAVSTMKQILDLGVPGILMAALGLTIYLSYKVIGRLVDRIEAKEADNKELHKSYASKVEELMGRIVETNGQLVQVIEQSNSRSETFATALRENQELLTKYRAELAIAKRT